MAANQYHFFFRTGHEIYSARALISNLVGVYSYNDAFDQDALLANPLDIEESHGFLQWLPFLGVGGHKRAQLSDFKSKYSSLTRGVPGGCTSGWMMIIPLNCFDKSSC